MGKKVYFERALFFSWYCGLGDCTFCYMSLLKDKIEDPKKARRSFESIFAETIICKKFNWKIEFLSGGYESYSVEELLFLTKGIYSIIGERLWLNIGFLSRKELLEFKPYIEGYAGTVETVNWNLRKNVCPSKSMVPILKSFEYCDELGLKKAITIIIGLGESSEDISELINFIKQNKISRITFYALNPHPGTPFKKSPELDYYSKWISSVRDNFPDIDIIAGAWIDKPEYYAKLLKSGANAITKLPTIRMFNSEKIIKIEESIKEAGFEFGSVFSGTIDFSSNSLVEKLDPEFFTKEMKSKIIEKLNSYFKKMKK